ncbi:hypothetical protein INT45_001751 [Circinella minor]|uniref:Uncharacterized protein n=1 Tax=Circinella minor TaxID=1195481 RepID=A0A8H7VK23_9FUNG|nr:hypothetical protein INT45_001751 [Circinella minor]
MKRASNRLRNRSPQNFIDLETFDHTRRSNRLRNRSPDQVIDLETFERTRRQVKRQERQRQAAAITTTTTTLTTTKKQVKKVQSKQSKGKKIDTSTKDQQKAEASSSKSDKPSDEQENKEQENQPVRTMSPPKSPDTLTPKGDLNITEDVTSPECYIEGKNNNEQPEAPSTVEPQSQVSEEQNPSNPIVTKKRLRTEMEEPEVLQASSPASSSAARQQTSQEPDRASNVVDDDKGNRFSKRIKAKKEHDVTTEHDDLSPNVPKTDDDVKSKDSPSEESDEEVKHKQDEQDEQKEASEEKQSLMQA